MIKIVRLIALWSMRIMLKKLENTKSTLDDKVVVSIYSDAMRVYKTTIILLEVQNLD